MAFGGVHPFMLKAAGGGGGGDLFSVAPCLAPSTRVLCEDTGSVEPSVDDVVTYGDLSNTYCGTIAATGQGGSAVYDLVDSGYSDCDECASSLGGGP